MFLIVKGIFLSFTIKQNLGFDFKLMCFLTLRNVPFIFPSKRNLFYLNKSEGILSNTYVTYFEMKIVQS